MALDPVLARPRGRLAAPAARPPPPEGHRARRWWSPTGRGCAVVAAIGDGQVAFVHEGEAVTVPAELPQAVLEAFNAIDALVEGRAHDHAPW